MPKVAGSGRVVHGWTRYEKRSKIANLWAYDNRGKGCEVKDQWLCERVKCGIKLLSSSICRLKGCSHGKWPVIEFFITAVHWVFIAPCNLIGFLPLKSAATFLYCTLEMYITILHILKNFRTSFMVTPYQILTLLAPFLWGVQIYIRFVSKT
jgi:hypothetical protein